MKNVVGLQMIFPLKGTKAGLWEMYRALVTRYSDVKTQEK
jgi:hypothetical protein